MVFTNFTAANLLDNCTPNYYQTANCSKNLIECFKNYLALNFQRFSGSIIAILGILVADATYRTTKNRWVLSVLTMSILSSIAEVAQASSISFTVACNQNIYEAITTFFRWSLYLMCQWAFAYKYIKCSFIIPKEVETQIIQPRTPIELKITNIVVYFII